MSQALITISTLPFHLVNDLWRWRAFRGEYEVKNWNDEYWKLKESILGVQAPVERTDEDLDITALFHVNQDYDMIRYAYNANDTECSNSSLWFNFRYFSRTLLQFQFMESLCKTSGHRGPLHRCDFSTSREAGESLARMLKLGNSQPWPDVSFRL